MPVTAAITASIGAAGAIGSSVIQSNAAKNAAAAQVAMQQQALNAQTSLYDTGLSTAKNALNPFISGGQAAIPTLQNLLTPGSGISAATLAQMPGFAFASQYGTQAATNALAAKGLGASGGPLATAISQYNQGLASNQFQNIVGDLQGFVNTGANAAGTLGNAAVTGAVNEGQLQGNTLTGIGQSQAQGILGQSNALSNGLTGVTGSLSNAALLSGLGGGNGLYGNVGSMPATGPGAPSDMQSNIYALSQGINPFG